MSEYWTRRRALTTTKDADDDDDDDDDWKPSSASKTSSPRMVKTLPERVRTRVHHTISPSQTQKSAPPATTPRGDKKSDDDSIAKRERERERETKKERCSPAAGDDPLTVATIYTWDWMLWDPNTHKLERRQNATRRRPLLLFRVCAVSCVCQRFASFHH